VAGGAALIVTDLHTDFVADGPMAASDSVTASQRLVAEVRLARAALNQRDTGPPPTVSYRAVIVVVEGDLWGTRLALPSGCPHPPHGEGPAFRRLLPGVEVGVDCPYVWEACPACGGDPLAASFDGKGQLVSLDTMITTLGIVAAHIVGLSLEHGGLPLAAALSPRVGVTVLAGRSTFLNPAVARQRIDMLEGKGVCVDWERPQN
jgi:hypothetical protein